MQIPHRAGSVWRVQVSYAVAMCGTTMPTPLYPKLQQIYGLGVAGATQLFAVYALAVLAMLSLYGALSDAVGRKSVMYVSMSFAALSGVLYFSADTAAALFLARILSGLCAGLITGTATAYLVDLTADSNRGASQSSLANMIGLASGPILAALLALVFPTAPMTGFAVHAVLSVLCIAALISAPETVLHRRWPRLSVVKLPRTAWRSYARGGLRALGFAVMGGCTAMTSILVVDEFGIGSMLVLGLIGALIFAATAVGQKVGGAPSARKTLRTFILLSGGCGLIAIAPWLPASTALVIYLFGLIVAGFSHGMLFPTGLAIVLESVDSGRRGSAGSAFWVLCYGLTAIGAVLLGQMGEFLGEAVAVSSFGLIVCAASLAAGLVEKAFCRIIERTI